MFLKSGNGKQIEWSVFSLATRVVRESGRASSMQDCLAQAGEGEDVILQKLPPGTIVNPDGSTEQAKPAPIAATIADVKAFASKRLSYTDWMVTRAAEPGGKPIPDDILAIRARIRDRAATIEAMDPIPTDFRDPKYWT